MTSKRAFKIWMLITFAILGTLGATHAWILWQTEGAGFSVSLPLLEGFGLQISAFTYFLLTLGATICLVGGICAVAFHDEALDLALYQLSMDFEGKLDGKGQEIKDSINEALSKLGLRGYQTEKSVKALQKKFEAMHQGIEEAIESGQKSLRETHKGLAKIERATKTIQTAQEDLAKLKRKAQALDKMKEDLRSVQETMERVVFIPEPCLDSTAPIRVLEGKVLRRGTVRQLESIGIKKIEDILLKSPAEVAHTEALSESEARDLQGIVQLLMVPGIQHNDAMLLIESGVDSKQELAVQDALSLGVRMSKAAEHYIEEGKIGDGEKPTLEEIAVWIRWARTL